MRWKEIFSSIDAHVGGQPLRLITFGVPKLETAPVRAQVEEFRARYDHIRSWLLAEPRGHAGMTGAILTQSPDPGIDYGVIFMSSGGYKPMSGHGMIALTTALIDTGAVRIDGPDTRINFETLAGPIQARASVDNGDVRGVRFRNVPSFRTHKDFEVSYEGRKITVDIAYGGAWYAIARAEDLGVALEPNRALALKLAGMAVAEAVSESLDLVHPTDPAMSGLFGTVILGDPHNDEITSRNATVYMNGLIDRSPCGTGMSATMACMAEDGLLQVGQPFMSESIMHSIMSGRISRTTEVGGYQAIIPEIAGRGQVTGMHQFFIDPSDPLGQGFVLL
jgi:trans-L-3-hydroxyproline dehydratase